MTGEAISSSPPMVGSAWPGSDVGMVRQRSLILVLFTMLLCACVHEPIIELSPGDSALQRWVNSDLAPYLSEQLSEHPRFKGEPVILVQLDGQDVQSDIDGLTRMLRDQLMDHLLAEPGITLPWQPQQRPPQHHRRLDNVQCRRANDASTTIGIEITELADGRYRVSVRALDVQEAAWVSGFGRSWTGRLTTAERDARQNREPDESLRGLRVLPFDGREPDLAATYLANNLSCLLRQGDADDLVLYVESLQSDHKPLRILPDLIGNNLSRFREVRVTDNKKEANFVLRGEAYEIHDGLHQVWVVLNPSESGQHLEGMDTATWMLTRSNLVALAAPVVAKPRPMSSARPQILSLGLAVGSGLDHVCAGRNHNGQSDCHALQLTVQQTQGVFVFVHDNSDGISRLSSGRCRVGSPVRTGRPMMIRYALPTDRFSDPGWPTVYAIAVGDRRLARRFEQHLAHLPDACTSATGLRGAGQVTPWLDRLDGLIAANGQKATWTARRLQ